jgi:hypothetical protein
MPNPRRIKQVKSNTETVTPEVGLFEEPTSPAMYPAIALAINANRIAKTAIIPETTQLLEIHV